MGLTFSFLCDGGELRLPVPPIPFGWGAGQGVRQLTVNGAGMVYLPAGLICAGALAIGGAVLSCMGGGDGA